MKTCKGCMESLPIDAFYMRKIGIPYTLCKLCYQSDRKARDLARIHSGTEKECNACHEILPLDRFSKNRSGKLGRCETCKGCISLDGLRKKYGITNIEEMIAAVEGKCQICGRDFSESAHGKPAVDHNHNCCPGTKTCGKCVRGLLCSNCNQGIGKMGDNPETLEKAAQYLRSFE